MASDQQKGWLRTCARMCVMDGIKKTRSNQRNFRTTYGESTLSRRLCMLSMTDKKYISKSCIITEFFKKLFYIIFTNIRPIIYCSFTCFITHYGGLDCCVLECNYILFERKKERKRRTLWIAKTRERRWWKN
jgi:hypothetical protein